MKKLLLLVAILAFSSMPVLASSQIVINEIMYNSDGTDVEFVELYNNTTQAIDLQGWYLVDDNDEHPHCVITGTLNAGAYLVIAENIAQFNQKYPGITNVNTNEYGTGTDAWGLGNGGDEVRLFDNSGALHDIVVYEDGGDWPGSPDGNGPSLELLHPALDNTLPTSWDPSQNDGGTPGQKNSVYTENVAPICRDGDRAISLPTSTENVKVTVTAFDNEGLEKVELYVNAGQGYIPQLMYDNGSGGDAVANDSIYTALIAPQAAGALVKYYAVATDDIGQADAWPNQAPTEYFAYTVDYTPPKLRITEVLPANDTINKDEAGEYDDWFEIQNQDEVTVNIGGMFVSSDLGNSRGFELPSVNLAPNQFIIIWADNDTEQGSLHTDFKLDAGGEAVGLFETNDHGNVLIHGWKFGVMGSDISMGFKPMTGNMAEYLKNPTPGASNETSELFSPICINEFQSTSDFGGTDDWVEIYNRGTEPYDLTGHFLSDNRNKNTKWQFPDNAIINPGEYIVVYEDELDFGFSSDGDDVIMLTSADSTVGLDFYDFGPQVADHSQGRSPDGTNNWITFSPPTKGSANYYDVKVENSENPIAVNFRLDQNFPNPFNPVTSIQYELPAKTLVKITVFDMLGRHVKTLVSSIQTAGIQHAVWNATDDAGNPVASGIYVYRIQTADFQQSRKMLLMR